VGTKTQGRDKVKKRKKKGIPRAKLGGVVAFQLATTAANVWGVRFYGKNPLTRGPMGGLKKK